MRNVRLLQRLRLPLIVSILVILAFAALLLVRGALTPRTTPDLPSYGAGTGCFAAHSFARRTVQPTSCPANKRQGYYWALIGDDGAHLAAERRVGIVAKVIRLSWREFAPHAGIIDQTYVGYMRSQFDRLRAAGFEIILDPGIHDAPLWTHQHDGNTYYVDQYGDRYDGAGTIDSGDLNLIFNHTLRGLVTTYLHDIFVTFGTAFAGVRMGGGHWGELTYPFAAYNGHTNCYWAFDRLAQAASPVPGWRPGQASPAGEARRFLTWYLNELTAYELWQITTIRHDYAGPLMILYPSWGIRPGQEEEAIADNLAGTSPAEAGGDLSLGVDYARQIAAVADPRVVVYTTWLDAPDDGDDSPNPQRWSPVKYLAHLAGAHHPSLSVFGENTGQGHEAALELAARQVQRYGLMGLAWYREDELFSGQYASLDAYGRMIASTNSTNKAEAGPSASRMGTPTMPPANTAISTPSQTTLATSVGAAILSPTMPATSTIMSNPITTATATSIPTATATSALSLTHQEWLIVTLDMSRWDLDKCALRLDPLLI